MPHTLDTLVDNTDLGLAHRVRGPQTPAQTGSPCLILLHGVGSNEANLAGFAAMQDPRLTVILGRGPLTFGPGQFGWFQVNFTANGPIINAPQAEASRQLLVDFIGKLPAAYGVDPRRIWIAGFSQGGIMSASVGLTRPDVVAGFGLMSGRILPEIGPLIAPPDQLASLDTFVSHGTMDDKLPVALAHRSRDLLTDKGVRFDYREYPAGHELNQAMAQDFVTWLTSRIDAA